MTTMMFGKFVVLVLDGEGEVIAEFSRSGTAGYPAGRKRPACLVTRTVSALPLASAGPKGLQATERTSM
jgi:hypothetical protein